MNFEKMTWLDHATYLYSSVIAAGTGAIYVFNLTDCIYNLPFTCAAMPYFFIDFFFCNPANKVHHICVVWLILSMLRDPHPAISLYMYKMELTTLLYNVLPYVPTSTKKAFTLLFFACFTKVRVIEGYYFIKSIEGTMVHCEYLRIPFYVLYAVNLYWFSLMLRKMWGKNFAKGPQYVKMCQQIAAFTYLGTLPATASCLPVLAVHACTNVTSYFYHSSKAAGRPSRTWFVLDSAAVHTILVMNVAIANPEWLGVSVANNAAFLALRLSIDDSKAIAISSVSIVLDSVLILGADVSNLFRIDYLLQCYIICLIFYVDFFNDLTYLCFHVLMWFNAHTMVSLKRSERF